MGRFIFYFASQAYFDNRRGTDGAFPLQGVKDYGALAHKYNIPVTWITNAEGLRRGKAVFDEFHEKYGDEAILMGLPFMGKDTSAKRDYAIKMTEDEIVAYLKKELDEMKAICDWVRTDHIGYFYRTPAAIKAMEKLGIKSCYGHCWEQIATDGVTDSGAPWGFYYIDSDVCWKRPSKSKHGVVANEWLQHQLNMCWNYYGSASVYTWDPNDVERARVCDGREIDFWKEGFKEYYENRKWNYMIPFVFHQEAHEQESTPGGWEVYPPETVQNTYDMTDEFLKFITSGEFPDMEIMTLPNAVEEYRKSFDLTQNTYMLFSDLEIKRPEWQALKEETYKLYMDAKKDEEEDGGTLHYINDYDKLKFIFNQYGWQGMIHEKRFPDSLIVVTIDGQFYFHKGQACPVHLWNYNKPLDTDVENLYFNRFLFKMDGLDEIKKINADSTTSPDVVFECQINSPIDTSYGLAIWDDHPISKVNQPHDITVEISHDGILVPSKIKVIPNKVIVITFNLSAGLNLVKVVLKPREN